MQSLLSCLPFDLSHNRRPMLDRHGALTFRHYQAAIPIAFRRGPYYSIAREIYPNIFLTMKTARTERNGSVGGFTLGPTLHS